MTASTFIARILGPLLVVIGIGLFVEGGSFAAIAGDFVQNGALIYLSGLYRPRGRPRYPQCASHLGVGLARGDHDLRLARTDRRHLSHPRHLPGAADGGRGDRQSPLG